MSVFTLLFSSGKTRSTVKAKKAAIKAMLKIKQATRFTFSNLSSGPLLKNLSQTTSSLVINTLTIKAIKPPIKKGRMIL